MKKIGITLDHEKGENGQYSKYDYYALREHYTQALEAFGAVPILMSYDLASVDTYADIIDGLLITGGNFDVSPAMYGQEISSDTVATKDKRTLFEIAITKRMLAQNKPILGICGGEQLLNVILGGTLIQHIPDTVENALEHEQPTPRNEVYHSIAVVKDTLLHGIVGQDEIMVNSAHHQAVLSVGEGVIVNATADDGVIEGIEYTEHPFCLGVQWHPEFLITENDKAIFERFTGL